VTGNAFGRDDIQATLAVALMSSLRA
jgi:hypothetical protein